MRKNFVSREYCSANQPLPEQANKALTCMWNWINVQDLDRRYLSVSFVSSEITRNI